MRAIEYGLHVRRLTARDIAERFWVHGTGYMFPSREIDDMSPTGKAIRLSVCCILRVREQGSSLLLLSFL